MHISIDLVSQTCYSDECKSNSIRTFRPRFSLPRPKFGTDPFRCPHAFPSRRLCKNQTFSISLVSNHLRTLCTNRHPEIPFNSILINALRTLAKTMDGCTPFGHFQFPAGYCFQALTVRRACLQHFDNTRHRSPRRGFVLLLFVSFYIASG